MKFRICSDFHLEFYRTGQLPPSLPATKDEKNTVLLLAGDIGMAIRPESYVPFLDEMAYRFKYVCHIAGNHEFYGGSFINARELIRENCMDAGFSDNVSLMEREVLEFDGVRIIAATLWSDMDRENPLSMQLIPQYLSDYGQIKTGSADKPTKYFLHPEDTIEDFKKSRDFIFDELKNAKADGKKAIVMSHHAPSTLSISPRFIGSKVNGAFVSDLSEEILDVDFEFTWLHGHVHQNQDYKLGKCHVICNPYGYSNENSAFKHDLVIEL